MQQEAAGEFKQGHSGTRFTLWEVYEAAGRPEWDRCNSAGERLALGYSSGGGDETSVWGRVEEVELTGLTVCCGRKKNQGQLFVHLSPWWGVLLLPESQMLIGRRRNGFVGEIKGSFLGQLSLRCLRCLREDVEQAGG